jgi:glycosyltransferase involved in cell wall biosynthesis
MPKLFFCTYSHNPWGGIEIWLAGLAQHLARHGWEVVVGLARGRTHNDPERVRGSYAGLPTVALDGRTGTSEGRIRAVLRAVSRVGPDVIIPVGLGDVLPAMARLKAAGGSLRLLVPVRAVNPGLYCDVQRYGQYIDRLVGVNPLDASYLVTTGALPPDRAETIINGVELPPACRAPRAAGVPLRVAFVGRLNDVHKRVSDLVPFVEGLSGRGVPFVLTVVGSGECEDGLRRSLAGYVGRGAVVFRGHLPPQAVQTEVFPRQDVLLLLSQFISEGCPQVVQQALAHGVVPVCSAFLGVHSLGFVRHDETALIFPVGEPATAAHHVEQLARDNGRLEELSRAGRAATEAFPMEWSRQRWRNAFQETLDRPVRGRGDGAEELLRPGGSGGRLERLGLSAGAADGIRRLLRRWPCFADGWAEWPGSLSHLDGASRAAMQQELTRLDLGRRSPARPDPVFP